TSAAFLTEPPLVTAETPTLQPPTMAVRPAVMSTEPDAAASAPCSECISALACNAPFPVAAIARSAVVDAAPSQNCRLMVTFRAPMAAASVDGPHRDIVRHIRQRGQRNVLRLIEAPRIVQRDVRLTVFLIDVGHGVAVIADQAVGVVLVVRRA